MILVYCLETAEFVYTPWMDNGDKTEGGYDYRNMFHSCDSLSCSYDDLNEF